MTTNNIDGFVRHKTPHAVQRRRPAVPPGRPAQPPTPPAPAVRAGVLPSAARSRTPVSRPAPPAQPQRLSSAAAASPASGSIRKKRRKGMPALLQLPLTITGAMAAGILAQSEIIGQLFVVAYGIAAFIWRIPSRTTFTLALLSLVATTLLLVVRGNIPLAQSFATYTFLLLVVGVLTLNRELRKEGGRIYTNRKIASNN